MNHEILFRGKNPDGKWEYGQLVEEYGTVVTRGAENRELLQCCIFIDHNTFCIVDPETVGQFTGLCDKYGKRIFEGDIVEHTTFHNDDKVRTGIVVYIEEYGAFFIVGSGYSDNQLYAFCNFKVVGNVYDNPELLEEKNEQKI